MFIEIGLGVLAFVLVLMTVTYATALLADVTGLFRTLFIEKPYRQAFRFVRWVLAGVVALGIVAVIE